MSDIIMRFREGEFWDVRSTHSWRNFELVSTPSVSECPQHDVPHSAIDINLIRIIYNIWNICEIWWLYPASPAWNEPGDTLRIATPLAVAWTRGSAQGPPYLQTSLPDANLRNWKSWRSPCNNTNIGASNATHRETTFSMDKLPKTWILSWLQTVSNAFVAAVCCWCLNAEPHVLNLINFCPMLQGSRMLMKSTHVKWRCSPKKCPVWTTLQPGNCIGVARIVSLFDSRVVVFHFASNSIATGEIPCSSGRKSGPLAGTWSAIERKTVSSAEWLLHGQNFFHHLNKNVAQYCNMHSETDWKQLFEILRNQTPNLVRGAHLLLSYWAQPSSCWRCWSGLLMSLRIETQSKCKRPFPWYTGGGYRGFRNIRTWVCLKSCPPASPVHFWSNHVKPVPIVLYDHFKMEKKQAGGTGMAHNWM